MNEFTLWEKDENGQWRAVMSLASLEEAEDLLRGRALEFLEEYGCAPRRGLDFKLTRDIEPRLDLWDERKALRAMDAAPRPRSF